MNIEIPPNLAMKEKIRDVIAYLVALAIREVHSDRGTEKNGRNACALDQVKWTEFQESASWIANHRPREQAAAPSARSVARAISRA